MTFFNLNYLLKDPIPKYSHTWGSGGQDFNICILGVGDTGQPITALHLGSCIYLGQALDFIL